MSETFPDGSVNVNEVATIIMSPQHAKEFAEKLTKNVKQYEDEILNIKFKQKYKNVKAALETQVAEAQKEPEKPEDVEKV